MGKDEFEPKQPQLEPFPTVADALVLKDAPRIEQSFHRLFLSVPVDFQKEA